jgi:hypothetical protein
VSQHEAAAERLGCQPRRSQWPTTSIPGLIERTANGGQPDHPARSRRRPPVSRSARSWAGADLPIEARSGQPHHSATAKQYCPSSSFRARHLCKRAIAASYARLYALARMRGYPRRAARQHISKNPQATGVHCGRFARLGWCCQPDGTARCTASSGSRARASPEPDPAAPFGAIGKQRLNIADDMERNTLRGCRIVLRDISPQRRQVGNRLWRSDRVHELLGAGFSFALPQEATQSLT